MNEKMFLNTFLISKMFESNLMHSYEIDIKMFTIFEKDIHNSDLFILKSQH